MRSAMLALARPNAVQRLADLVREIAKQPELPKKHPGSGTTLSREDPHG
jgi:hypothetical protein